MVDPPHALEARLRGAQLYRGTGDGSFVRRRCGTSRPTLRKRRVRYQAEGGAGLRSRSRRPHTTTREVTDEHVERVRHLRLEREPGPERIQAGSVRPHGLHLAASAVRTVLRRNGWRYGPRGRPPPKRYAEGVPGDRVEVDTVEGGGPFQYTATDDRTRVRVPALYPKRDAAASVGLLRGHVVEGSPSPVQRIRTDRGGESSGVDSRRALTQERVRSRPVRPRSAHLNGKVLEREGA